MGCYNRSRCRQCGSCWLLLLVLLAQLAAAATSAPKAATAEVDERLIGWLGETYVKGQQPTGTADDPSGMRIISWDPRIMHYRCATGSQLSHTPPDRAARCVLHPAPSTQHTAHSEAAYHQTRRTPLPTPCQPTNKLCLSPPTVRVLCAGVSSQRRSVTIWSRQPHPGCKLQACLRLHVCVGLPGTGCCFRLHAVPAVASSRHSGLR
jgi:hypothetical protein